MEVIKVNKLLIENHFSFPLVIVKAVSYPRE